MEIMYFFLFGQLSDTEIELSSLIVLVLVKKEDDIHQHIITISINGSEMEKKYEFEETEALFFVYLPLHQKYSNEEKNESLVCMNTYILEDLYCQMEPEHDRNLCLRSTLYDKSRIFTHTFV